MRTTICDYCMAAGVVRLSGWIRKVGPVRLHVCREHLAVTTPTVQDGLNLLLKAEANRNEDMHDQHMLQRAGKARTVRRTLTPTDRTGWRGEQSDGLPKTQPDTL